MNNNSTLDKTKHFNHFNILITLLN
uniref:Uncharacterized protein n=1 Tax=Arundo donax TaxID=35708 RepID=A0A0A9CE86_ARUDO